MDELTEKCVQSFAVFLSLPPGPGCSQSLFGVVAVAAVSSSLKKSTHKTQVLKYGSDDRCKDKTVVVDVTAG